MLQSATKVHLRINLLASTSSIPTQAESAGRWFLHSGIQEENGGVARYHREDLGRNARVSTEITGYAVSTLVWLYRRTGDAAYLAAARHSARFLTDTAWDEVGSVWPFEHSAGPSSDPSSDPKEAPEPVTYFFDTGIIVRGLLALWRVSGERKWVEAAIRGGESMRLFRTGRTMNPMLRAPSLQPLPYTPQWSRSPGCYQLKSALAWHELAAATGREDFRSNYEESLGMALVTANSFLPAETPPKTMDRLHAFGYFLEAVLVVAEREEVKAALVSGIERMSRHLREIRSEFERSDVNAQLLRVRLLADQAGAASLNRAEAEEEAGRIPMFQDRSDRPRSNGGYSFGVRNGVMVPHSNPVSTAFCMQALEMWSDFRQGVTLDPASLI